LSTPASLCIASEAGFMGVSRTETALCEIDAPFRLAVVSGIGDRQLLERFTVPSDSDGGVQLWVPISRRSRRMDRWWRWETLIAPSGSGI
jgi:hypothetical protein